MLAGGVLLSGFYGDGTHLVVEYGVVGEEAEPFAVAVYRSADGVAAEGLLARVEVRDAADLRPGSGHRLALQAAFADIESDYTLVAKIEGAEQAGQAVVFQDASPQDTRRFEGGVFLAADGTLYVHGTAGEDRVAVALADSGGIRVGLNDVWYAYPAEAVAAVHIRPHQGEDIVATSGVVSVPVWVFGGPGQRLCAWGQWG